MPMGKLIILLLMASNGYASSMVQNSNDNIPVLTISADNRDECFTTKTTRALSIRSQGRTVIEETECKKIEERFQAQIFYI